MGVGDFAHFYNFSFLTDQIPLTPPNKLTVQLLGKSHHLDLMTGFWALKFLLCQPRDNLPSTVPTVEDGLGAFHSYSFRVFLALAYYSLKSKLSHHQWTYNYLIIRSFQVVIFFSLLCYLFVFQPIVWGKKWVIV